MTRPMTPMNDPFSRPARLQAQRLIRRTLAIGLAGLTGLMALASHAQGLSLDAPAVTPRIPGMRQFSASLQLPGAPTTADYIVAVVNQEPITHTDLDQRVARVQETASAGTHLPAPDELRHQVLEALIDEKVQLTYARSIGMSVSENEVDAAIESVASQNHMSLDQFRSRLRADGLDYDHYRASLREQMLVQHVREREVNARITISDEELDAYLKNDPAAQTPLAMNIAHILVAVPDGATGQQIQSLQDKAEDLRKRAAAGENFATLALLHSDDARTRETGGQLGMREVKRLPEMFVAAAQGVKVGGVGPVVRSNAGFHIIKLIERENASQATYTEQHARHILMLIKPQRGEAELIDKLKAVRQQIVDGQASFAQMARQYSEDGSAAKGGDLGWSAPGQFVPEFEQVLLSLQPGQISEPVVSRFGVHLIQLLDRREVQLTQDQRRDAARSVLRERKYESTYESWAQELRAQAYVDIRDGL